jgi:hypothetical protein
LGQPENKKRIFQINNGKANQVFTNNKFSKNQHLVGGKSEGLKIDELRERGQKRNTWESWRKGNKKDKKDEEMGLTKGRGFDIIAKLT